jgi:ketosteroid isomerase-like protein
MNEDAHQIAERYFERLAAGDVDAVLDLYATDAHVVRYEGVAIGRDQIRNFLAGMLAAHGRFDLVSIDEFAAEADVVEWDATVETRHGMLRTSSVMTLDADGAILRHVPSIRGYWGEF